MAQGLTNLEFQGGGEKEVLLCISPGAYSETIRERLLREGYRISSTSIPKDALKQLQIGRFQAVIVEESFIKDDKSLTTYLDSLPMDSRRNIIYVLIGRELTTGDRIGAYVQSADLVVNTKDIGSLDRLLNETIEDHQELYKTFKNTLQEVRG